jgi:integrase
VRGQLNYLNDTQLQRAKPREQPWRLNDGGGLFLLIKPNGSRLWRMKFRFEGREGLASFGKYPQLSLAAARKRRAKIWKQIEDGIHPGEAKRQAKHSRSNTLQAVTERWLSEQKAPSWSPKHLDLVERTLKRDVYPVLGNKPAAEVTTRDIIDIANAIIDSRGAYVMARKVAWWINASLRYAAANGTITVAPAPGISEFIKKAPAEQRSRKMPSLHWKEIPEFLNTLADADIYEQTRLALRLAMLTFVRSGELRLARWEEFDLEQRLWTIPGQRMKGRREDAARRPDHLVPLSKQAFEVLSMLKAFAGDSELLLPGNRDLERPISYNTMIVALYRMGLKGKMSVHGFRAMASSWLNEQGHYTHHGQVRRFSKDAIERQLAHGEPDAVRDAYNRADYMGEREAMMQAWADFIDLCANVTDNVVLLTGS